MFWFECRFMLWILSEDKVICYDFLKLVWEVVVFWIMFNLVFFFLINEYYDMFIIVIFGDDDE